MSEDYDFYEDPDQDKSVSGFVLREKRILGFLAMFLGCSLVFSCIDRQMDSAAAQMDARDAQAGSRANPWSIEK